MSTPRRCLVTGGTGFIGRELCRQLVDRGWQLTVLTRQGVNAEPLLPDHADLVERLSDISRQRQFDAVVNLAGEPIADARWSAKRKRSLERSRIGVTQQLITWMHASKRRPEVLVSGSAVGWYGDRGARELTESDSANEEYTHRLCNGWENAALGAEALGVRTCLLRIGLVVGPDGGFLRRMLPPFKLGLGGPIGDGSQWMSWIHRQDLVAMIIWLLNSERQSGVYNGTAPAPVTNREFSATLGRILNKPAKLPLPGLVLKLAFGEMSRLLLTGQRVLPKRALDGGFRFLYPVLDEALRDCLKPGANSRND